MLYAPQHTGPAAPVRPLACLMLLALLFVAAQPLHPVPPPAPAPALPVAEQLGRLPLAFEPAAPGGTALFQARALGGMLFFAPGEVLLARPDSAAVRVRFLGGRPGRSGRAVRPAARPGQPLHRRRPDRLADRPAHLGRAGLPLGRNDRIQAGGQTQALGAGDWSQMLSLDWEQPALPDDLLCDGPCQTPHGQLLHAGEIFLPLVRR